MKNPAIPDMLVGMSSSNEARAAFMRSPLSQIPACGGHLRKKKTINV
jgi:hypothetical protein